MHVTNIGVHTLFKSRWDMMLLDVLFLKFVWIVVENSRHHHKILCVGWHLARAYAEGPYLLRATTKFNRLGSLATRVVYSCNLAFMFGVYHSECFGISDLEDEGTMVQNNRDHLSNNTLSHLRRLES